MCLRKPHEDKTPKGIFNHILFDDDTLEYDISLVKIEKVKLTSHIQKIALPKATVCDDQRRRKKKKRKNNGKRKRRRKVRGKSGRGKRKGRKQKKKVKKKKGNGKDKWKKQQQMVKDLETVIKKIKDKMLKDGSGSGYDQDGGQDGGSGESDECNIEKERKKRKRW